MSKDKIILKLEIRRHTSDWLVGRLIFLKKKTINIAHSTEIEIMKEALRILKTSEKEGGE